MNFEGISTLVAGGGLAGALAVHFLRKAGESVLWIDAHKMYPSTSAGAGIMNPVTGRKYVYSWRFEDFHQEALNVYRELEQETGFNMLHKMALIKSLYTPGDVNNWCLRMAEPPYNIYMQEPVDVAAYPFIKTGFQTGRIEPVYRVDLSAVVLAITRLWGSPLNAEIKTGRTMLMDGKEYILPRDLRLVLATGVYSGELIHPPLPIQPLKGEALLIACADLPEDVIIHHHLNLVPYGENRFWVGPSDMRHHTIEGPTPLAREQLELELNRWFDVKYTVLDVVAGVRPATLIRRPIVGAVPHQENTWVINGLGTKGASLAPLSARVLASDVMGRGHDEPELKWPWDKRYLEKRSIQ